MRLAILMLGRYARWPRAEIRAMSPNELADYLELLPELMKKTETTWPAK